MFLRLYLIIKKEANSKINHLIIEQPLLFYNKSLSASGSSNATKKQADETEFAIKFAIPASKFANIFFTSFLV